MPYLNRVFVMGHLGRDAELKYTPGGAAVSTFSLATTEKWRDKSGQPKEETTWHRIVLWGKQAEAISSYLVKGKGVLVEGRISNREFEKDGQKRTVSEIKADRVQLMGDGKGHGQPHEEPATGSVDTTDDQIPF